MKYRTYKEEVTTINADLVRLCFPFVDSLKKYNKVRKSQEKLKPKDSRKIDVKPKPLKAQKMNLVDFDTWLEMKLINHDEEDERALSMEEINKIELLEAKKYFKEVHMRASSSKIVRIVEDF